MTSKLDRLNQWVAEVARLTRPDAIQWCDGSDTEIAGEIRAGDRIVTGERAAQ